VIRLASAAIGAAVLTAGCATPPDLQAVTTPPPLADARLVDDGGDPSIVVSKGVALAFICTDPDTGEPCGGVSATMDDPTVASVMPGYLDVLSPAYQDPVAGVDGAQPQMAFVVMGLAEGDTALHFVWAPPNWWTSPDVYIPVSVVGE
jgi:hypothetical protein